MGTKKKTETAVAAKPKKQADPKPETARGDDLDVFISTRLEGIAQVARTRGVDQRITLGDGTLVTVYQNGSYKHNV